jgi:two-component system response regulator FixJ
MSRAPAGEAGSLVGSESSQARIVYVIDDDREIRVSVGVLLGANGYDVRPFASAADFLDELSHLRPGCLIVDIRMPDIDGIALLSKAAARGVSWPAIVVTGHAEVPTAVAAMKLGALDFLEKPFSYAALMTSLDHAFDLLEREPDHRLTAAAAERVAGLSKRERQIFRGILAGLANKEMALRLDLSHRTVEMHRLKMMRRLGVRKATDLFALAAAAGISAGDFPGD